MPWLRKCESRSARLFSREGGKNGRKERGGGAEKKTIDEMHFGGRDMRASKQVFTVSREIKLKWKSGRVEGEILFASSFKIFLVLAEQ